MTQMFIDHQKYIDSPKWKDVRETRLSIDDHKCAICESHKDLNVHHITYKNFGHENPEKDLLTLCHLCHALCHRIRVVSQNWSNERRQTKDAVWDINNPHVQKRLFEILCVEIILRDSSFSGDLNVFDTGQRMISKFINILGLVIPPPNTDYLDFSQTVLLCRVPVLDSAYDTYEKWEWSFRNIKSGTFSCNKEYSAVSHQMGIRDVVRIMRDARICEFARNNWTIRQIADRTRTSEQTVSKVLCRYGYNATAKIK